MQHCSSQLAPLTPHACALLTTDFAKALLKHVGFRRSQGSSEPVMQKQQALGAAWRSECASDGPQSSPTSLSLLCCHQALC